MALRKNPIAIEFGLLSQKYAYFMYENFAREYFRKQVTGVLKKKWTLTKEMLDIPEKLQQGII